MVIDLYSRRVVGWSLGSKMDASLVVAALKGTLQTRSGSAQTIFHSDRGSQYSSRAFRALLAQARTRQSISARANAYHNARTESFIGTLKLEMLQNGCFENLSDARAEIFEFIESFYTPKKTLRSGLSYPRPV